MSQQTRLLCDYCGALIPAGGEAVPIVRVFNVLAVTGDLHYHADCLSAVLPVLTKAASA